MAAKLTPEQLGTAPGSYNPAVPWAGPLSFVNPTPLNQPIAGQSHRIAPAAVAGIAAGAAALGGGIIGAASNAKQTAETNAANRDIAREQMMFQHNMSNTAYQRARVDMERAGINPMLAYMQGGASSPQGASATMVSPRTGDDINRAVSSTLSAISTAQELRSRESTIDLQKAQEAATVVEAKVKDETAKKVAEEAKQVRAQTGLLRDDARSRGARRDVEKAHADIDKENAKWDNWLERIQRTIGVAGSAAQVLNPLNYLKGSGRMPNATPRDSYERSMDKFKDDYYRRHSKPNPRD